LSKIGDPSDKVAGLDQFQPGLTKRGGKGAVTFEGVTYSRYEWVLRIARMGGTLHAGEGQLLAERIDDLEAERDGAFEDSIEHFDRYVAGDRR
jgi:hypothetical protein